MTPQEIFSRIADQYGLTPPQQRAWAEAYRDALAGIDPAMLAKAWAETQKTWRKRDFPKPADILAAMPASGTAEALARIRGMQAGESPRERLERLEADARKLVEAWLAQWGHWLAKQPEPLKDNLLTKLRDKARQRAFDPYPHLPIGFERIEVQIAQRQVISQRRVQAFGAIPTDPKVWADQMQQCAAALGLPWTVERPDKPKQRAA